MHSQNVHEQPTRLRRIIRRSTNWTLKEHEVVVSHWPDVDAIAKQLPHRTRRAISNFAGTCNLTKPIRFWTAAEDATLRRRVKEGVPRRQIATELGFTQQQVANRMNYANIRFGKRRPRPTGNLLMDSLFERAFELNLSRKELDEACNSGGAFRRWSPARRMDKQHIWKAVAVLGGRLMPHWDEL